MQNLETETGWLLRSKVNQINDKYHTDFELAVTDASGEEQDWLYCLMVGKRQFTDEYDGQELWAYLNGLYDGGRIGKNHGK